MKDIDYNSLGDVEFENLEQSLRNELKKNKQRLRKGNGQYGVGYFIVDENDVVIAGSNINNGYSMSIEDVVKYLEEE